MNQMPIFSAFHPSPFWTDKERLLVISSIVKQLRLSQFVDCHQTAMDAVERIQLVATANLQFLETNREAILKGQV